MARWRFTNVTKAVVSYPGLSGYDFTDSHPFDLATVSATLIDVDGTLDFDLSDEITVEYAVDGSTYIVVFGGILTSRTMTDMGRSDPRVWQITAQDYAVLLDDTLVEGTRGSETAKARIAWIMAQMPTQGLTATGLPTLGTSLEAHEAYRGMSKREALDEIAQIVDATWYVDFDKNLHFYTGIETNPAPFELIHPAAPPTSYPYWDFGIDDDLTDAATRVLVDGKTAQVWRTNATAETALGRQIQRAISDDTLDTTAKMNAAGDTFLANAWPPPRTVGLTLLQPGLRSGMTVHVAYDDWTAEGVDDDFIISSVGVEFLEPNAQDSDTDEDAGGRVFWKVTAGDKPRRTGGRGGGGGGGGTDVINRISRRRTPAPATDPETEADTEDDSELTVHLKSAVAQRVDFDATYRTSSFNYGTNAGGEGAGSWIDTSIAAADGNCGCGFANVGWSGERREEGWYEVDLSGGVDADWLGLRFVGLAATPVVPPTYDSFTSRTASSHRYIVGWGIPDPTAARQWLYLGEIDVYAAWEVFVPRSLLTAAKNALVVAPNWTCGGYFCEPEIESGTRGPRVGGEGNSARARLNQGGGDDAGPENTRCYSVVTSGAGRTMWVPGGGDVDGTNDSFELSDWNGNGVPQARVGGIIYGAADYTYDAGTLTVTFTQAPPAGSQPAFRYFR